MAVPCQGEIEVVGESLLSASIRERSTQHCSAKPGDHLHIAERRHVQVWGTRTEGLPDRPRGIRAEEVFEEGRCVSDDDPQEASRDARSSWISSAAGRPSFTCPRDSILSKTSEAGGLATSRSRSSWM